MPAYSRRYATMPRHARHYATPRRQPPCRHTLPPRHPPPPPHATADATPPLMQTPRRATVRRRQYASHAPGHAVTSATCTTHRYQSAVNAHYATLRHITLRHFRRATPRPSRFASQYAAITPTYRHHASHVSHAAAAITPPLRRRQPNRRRHINITTPITASMVTPNIDAGLAPRHCRHITPLKTPYYVIAAAEAATAAAFATLPHAFAYAAEAAFALPHATPCRHATPALCCHIRCCHSRCHYAMLLPVIRC